MKLLHTWTIGSTGADSISISLNCPFVLLLAKVRTNINDNFDAEVEGFRGYKSIIIPVDGCPYEVAAPSYYSGYILWRFYTATSSAFSWSCSYHRIAGSKTIEKDGVNCMVPYKLYSINI